MSNLLSGLTASYMAGCSPQEFSSNAPLQQLHLAQYEFDWFFVRDSIKEDPYIVRAYEEEHKLM